MKTYKLTTQLFLILPALLALAGCFDTDARPAPNTAGEVLGCVTDEGDLFCVTRYAHAETELPPIPTEAGVYLASIADIEQVYDGDTLTDVQILVAPIEMSTVEQLGEIFPNLVLKNNGIYVENGVRIAGIDTPEMRVSTKKADGTPRSAASRANEKKAAIAARDAVRRLIEANGMQFVITDTEHDKFGRVLGTVYAGEVNIGEYLIANRLALRYDGGTKAEPDWDTLDQGLMW